MVRTYPEYLFRINIEVMMSNYVSEANSTFPIYFRKAG